MNKRNQLLALMTMGLMAMGNSPHEPVTSRPADAKTPVAPDPKGMREWNIDGVVVKAVTKKAAIKKAKRDKHI